NARWAAYLSTAQFTGAVLYDSLQAGHAPPEGVTVEPLLSADAIKADAGRFDSIRGLPKPSFVTNLTLRIGPSVERSSTPLTLAIVSPDLRYPLASLSLRSDPVPSETLGALTRQLASLCSTPVLIAKPARSGWVKITGDTVWACTAAPPDLRLLAVGLALVSVGILVTLVLNGSAQFVNFAAMLRDRNRIGGPEAYATEGLFELRDIVTSVNGYLAIERDRLAKRVAVLSGVSHDLGTPATRLKLRAALIPDDTLRAKLDSDIDSMTGIIESVLTYTRAELDAELPRRISLTSLVQSIVDDYQDIGSPVEFIETQRGPVPGAQSLFMSRRGSGTLPDDDKVIITARPVSLGRAISNLIDNALKYGRRASVRLERNADTAVITVEDEGTTTSVQDIEDLMAPYKRGDNTHSISGFGLGLTIVSTVANLHGGALTFEPGSKGLLAKITILRR
ncbi:MAG: sensor histidine kinase, partial [Paracoccaceae bacterium]